MNLHLTAIALAAAAFTLQVHAEVGRSNIEQSPPCAKIAFPAKNWKQDQAFRKIAWSEAKLAAAQQYAASLHDQSFMAVQCGHLVTTWGDTSKKLTTFSVRKSLISALFGIYAAEGKIDLNQTLEQAGIDDLPSPLTKQERQARVIDLLRARSGVYHAASFETDFQRKLRPVRGSHAPGSFWFYNNWDFNALGTIFEKKTGLTIGEAFYQRIAKPTGMQDFLPTDVYYFGDETVSEHRAYMFRMTTRDMARFGLLYINHGRWKRKQIVPQPWVEKSTHASEMVRFGKMPVGGYENLWWVEYGGVHLGEATLPGMFSAQGAGGHYIVDAPSLGLVVVNQYDNEPVTYDARGVLLAAQDKHAIFDDQFDHLMKMLLEANSMPEQGDHKR
ncbi:MAG: beta-lactamase family protein [Acidobacteriota bacterium]|nr:beta-lactamase family protein [Acidobacteriota bacterium]